MEKEEEKEGGIGFIRSSYWSRKKDIKFSKYISDVLQKHRLLDRKSYDTSPDRGLKRNLAMARFIEKHRNNTGQIVIAEDLRPNFHYPLKVISEIAFGRPIIKSFTKILSKYHSKKYGGVLHHVLVDDDSSSFGQIANGDCGRFAKWQHVNYTAWHKNHDDDVYSTKLYFAEVIVFKFRLAGPLFCIVCECLPAEHDGSGTCQCLLPNCDTRIQHPSINAYVDASLSPVSPTILWGTASTLFQGHFWEATRAHNVVWLAKPSSWPFGRIPVEKLNHIPHRCTFFDSKIEFIRGDAEAKTEYLYRNENTLITYMSNHIPVPKIFLLSEVKRQSNGDPAEIQKRALAIAKCTEERKKRRMREPIPHYLFEDLSMELTKFWRETNGDDLEELNGSIINENVCPEHRKFTHASWIHLNFNAKRKNDDDSGVSENLYFAEVVQISHLFQNSIYKVKVCIPVDKNHPSGKCGMCKEYNICHPSQEGSYIDDTSKMNPSEFSEYMEGPNSIEEVLRRSDDPDTCCGVRRKHVVV